MSRKVVDQRALTQAVLWQRDLLIRAINKAIDTLERDGDEFGVASDLRASIEEIKGSNK